MTQVSFTRKQVHKLKLAPCTTAAVTPESTAPSTVTKNTTPKTASRTKRKEAEMVEGEEGGVTGGGVHVAKMTKVKA